MKNNRPYIIAETAFHHEGDEKFMMELIQELISLHPDAVKFHLLLEPESYMVPSHSVMPKIREWIFTREQWTRFIQLAGENGQDIVLLCNDVKSLEFVLSEHPDIRAVEIHATGINDIFLLEKAALFKSTVILGIGGSDIDEIRFAVDFLKSRGKEDILLMYGFQSFPTDYSNINLSKMIRIRDLFGLPVGYADHTDPKDKFMIPVSTMAAAMGFFTLEKHVTHKFGEARIDHQAAVSKEQFQEIKAQMEVLFRVYGSGSVAMSVPELSYGNTGPMKKALVASCKIAKGEKITLQHIGFKRTEESSYLPQKAVYGLIGLEAITDIEENEILDYSKLKYEFSSHGFREFSANKK